MKRDLLATDSHGLVNREGEMQSDERGSRKLRLEARQGMEATP